MEKKFAFTLAEVLITLVIIGVLAVLTVPTLLQKYQEHITISKVKKFYSTMSNAVQLAIKDNGTIDTWNANDNTLIDFFKDYLKIEKICGLQPGCLATQTYNLNKTSSWSYDSSTYFKLVLQDGSSIWYRFLSSNCSYNDISDIAQNNNVCAYFYIDTTGKALPNRVGVDTFNFLLFKDKILPNNETASHKLCKLDSVSAGWGCTEYIIRNGNMDYLH